MEWLWLDITKNCVHIFLCGLGKVFMKLEEPFVLEPVPVNDYTESVSVMRAGGDYQHPRVMHKKITFSTYILHLYCSPQLGPWVTSCGITNSLPCTITGK